MNVSISKGKDRYTMYNCSVMYFGHKETRPWYLQTGLGTLINNKHYSIQCVLQTKIGPTLQK